ncbi:MAG: FimB/Mfa2 family fimbrial subunit [Bacteroidales bacterium]|nr:FimB/Mfa2 family fimbrial subunit [Bacteroidales bacterium]
MKKMMLFNLCAALLLLSSCNSIKDNYEDCETITLAFSYMGDGTMDIFQDKISSVSLYIYGADGSLHQTKTIEQNSLKAFQGTRLNLNPGSYTIVGVGNAFDKTTVENATAQDHSQIWFCNPATGKGVVEGNDSLYLGRQNIVVPEELWYNAELPFRSSHYKVSYTVKGYVEETNTKAGESLLELKVNNLLPKTDFNNRVFGDRITYNPVIAYNNNNGDHQSYFNIMRQGEPAIVGFELFDKKTGQTLHTLGLADFLAQFPQVDITKQEVLIPIEVVYKHTGVTITIPDWMINNVTPGYGTN